MGPEERLSDTPIPVQTLPVQVKKEIISALQSTFHLVIARVIFRLYHDHDHSDCTIPEYRGMLGVTLNRSGWGYFTQRFLNFHKSFSTNDIEMRQMQAERIRRPFFYKLFVPTI